MKIICILCLSIILFGCSAGSHIPAYEYPQNIRLQSAEDYAKAEPEVLRCIAYLDTVSLDEENARSGANRFLITWLSGSPTVNVEINPYLMKLVDRNKELLSIFMGGWTKYSIQNPIDKNKIKGHLAGLSAIIQAYKLGKGVKKDTSLEEIVSADQNGNLSSWLQANINKN
jgi:hypothetical protein